MSNPIRLPEPPLKRDHNLNVRLTAVERKAIQQLAQQMRVSSSHLVRHFLMLAVDFYTDRKEG